ncbi:hypothetical protein ACFCZ1_01375 [Streptomyces sp. NPDC056224]|uniref:hypothetical protein n=1 Tax=Streptomyces sp. NPDC056224 TaxID=3345750 RepID=UPI0035E21D16
MAPSGCVVHGLVLAGPADGAASWPAVIVFSAAGAPAVTGGVTRIRPPAPP